MKCGRHIAVEHRAIAPGDAPNHIQKVEHVGEGGHRTSSGTDKGVADAECREAINALWSTAFNTSDVLL